jgi:hypothetical protein
MRLTIVYDMGLMRIWGDADNKVDKFVEEVVVASCEANRRAYCSLMASSEP